MNDTYFLSSPYGGRVTAQNLAASIAKILHITDVGTDPITVPHLILPHYFDDTIEVERNLSIEICKRMMKKSDVAFFYAEFGFSPGMMEELRCATENKVKVEILFHSDIENKWADFSQSEWKRTDGLRNPIDFYRNSFAEYCKEIDK